MNDFNGFPGDLFAFFEELKANNQRAWFQDNKARYEAEVVAPMLAFIAGMGPRLAGISPHFVADPRRNGGSMFRIHRDVRFAPDKRPYKEHAACHFRHAAGRDAHAPGFYLHLEPGLVMIGGGIWLPPSEPLARIRGAIAEKPAAWSRVIANEALLALSEGIEGESLKRPPRGFSGDERHIADIRRKSFYAMSRGAAGRAARGDFIDEVAETFRAIAPLMRFLCRALDQPF
jgi:uncharacterized protein (TIGR02453 family)